MHIVHYINITTFILIVYLKANVYKFCSCYGKLSTSRANSHVGGSDSDGDNDNYNENINDMHLCKTSDRARRFVKGFPVTGQIYF
jgi:hypothetical protein